MLKAVMDVYGKLNESECPSADYLAAKAEETEINVDQGPSTCHKNFAEVGAAPQFRVLSPSDEGGSLRLALHVGPLQGQNMATGAEVGPFRKVR